MKRKSIIAFTVLLIIALIPIALYLSIFNHSLSHDNQTWGAFGSFIGGVYSSLFGFASAIILIITLYEMRSFNREQTEYQNREKTLDDIKMLCDLLGKSLNNNKFTHPSRQRFFEIITSQLAGFLSVNTPSDEEEVWNEAIQFEGYSFGFFEEEIPIVKEIFYRLKFIVDDDLKDIAKLLIKSELPPLERFWIECYIRKYHNYAKSIFDNWIDFSHIPTKILDKIPDRE